MNDTSKIELLNHTVLKKYENLYAATEKLIKEISEPNFSQRVFNSNLINLTKAIVQDIYDHEKLYIQLISYMGSNDPFVAHSLNTAIIALIIFFILNIDNPDYLSIVQAALLHDIGKIKYRKEIYKIFLAVNEDLHKIKLYHALWGKRLVLSYFKLSPEIASMVAKHHEQIDGTGFPNKLSKKDLTICDNILITANMIENILQKINYSGIENLTKTFEYIIPKYSDKFETSIKSSLIDLIGLKGKAARKYKRYQVNAQANIINPQNMESYNCIVIDISTGGMKISTNKVLNPNSIYKIDFQLHNFLRINNKLFQIKWKNILEATIEYGIAFFNPQENISKVCDHYFAESQHE